MKQEDGELPAPKCKQGLFPRGIYGSEAVTECLEGHRKLEVCIRKRLAF
jgi:hypothetical protein